MNLLKTGRGRVVIISASIGAGHDTAAREWQERLRQHGYTVEIHDLLDLLPPWAGLLLRETYRSSLHHAAWLWSLVFHLTQTRPVTRMVDAALNRHEIALEKATSGDVAMVISTYPLAGRILARLRRQGRLQAPVVSFITDFSVHRLWIADGHDAYLAMHEHTAKQARALGAHDVEVIGPLVPARFCSTSPAGRLAARAAFGLPPRERLALVVAGSWGVGDIERTAREIEATGQVRAIIACGTNRVLRERLLRAGVGRPLGWVDRMDDLLRAVDVVVENAGGLSAVEAMASGVPVITYRPIHGHGRANAAALDRTRLSVWVREREALGPILTAVLGGPLRNRLRRNGLAAFTVDPLAGPLERIAAGRGTGDRRSRPEAVAAR